MSGSIGYTTVDSSRIVLTHLYEDSSVSRYFACKIIVPAPGLDVVHEAEETLYISRRTKPGPDYEMAGGDRVYRTVAQLEPNGQPFDVDIIIHSREASLVGATISVSDEVNRIIAEQ